MDMLALFSAVLGILALILVFVLSKKIKYRWIRYLSVLVGVFIAVGIAGYTPPILGAEGYSTSEKAGEYMLYLGVVVIAIKLIFFSKKSESKEAQSS